MGGGEKNAGKDIVLETSGLRKSFGALRAVDDVSMSVRDSMITLIIGPNGSGKTTLINTIAGVYKPDSGRVRFRGIDITGWPPYKINELGLVRTFQIPQPFTKLMVIENLLISSRDIDRVSISRNLLRKWIEKESNLVKEAFNILKFLNLDKVWDHYAYELSGGQLKLLELGRALINKAKLIIMDEPIAGVAPTLAHSILGFMRKAISEYNVTFLIIEHRLDIALKYVDFVYAMHRGRIISSGVPDEVIKDPRVIESYLGEEIKK